MSTIELADKLKAIFDGSDSHMDGSHTVMVPTWPYDKPGEEAVRLPPYIVGLIAEAIEALRQLEAEKKWKKWKPVGGCSHPYCDSYIRIRVERE